ncbi:MAG: type II toxin-antitoxin system ParD family antitoxin [Candidatus Saccharimonas sp.]|nr:type II toxin-antitoxin system ParD family antitoxin [Planctomycetaceae bacterium]
MSIVLPPELERFVATELSNGRYQSEDDLVCDAVRLLRERRLHGLRSEIQQGLDQLSRGEGLEVSDSGLDSFFDSLEQEVGQELAAESRSP